MLFPPPPHSSVNRPHSDTTNNIMFLAIVSLLLVILFVLLLHIYARWFLFRATQRSTQTTVTLPLVLGSRLHHRFTANASSSSTRSTGLPSYIITSLPLFIYNQPSNFVLECAICLSVFQEEEIGRKLPGCGHVFHVDCIDMWLHSHSTCPICRAAILYNYHNRKVDNVNRNVVNHIEIVDHDEESQNIVSVEESGETTNAVLENECEAVLETKENGDSCVSNV